MRLFIKLVRKIVLPFYWMYKNFSTKSCVHNYNLSPYNKIGKKARVDKRTDIHKLSLGDYSSISGPHSYVEDAIIGKYCSIARNTIIGPSSHNYNWVTTSNLLVLKDFGFINQDILDFPSVPTIIGNDVWIGINAIVLRGVTIGDGAIIAAGAVVTKDVAPYSIVGGVPAKHIKFRYSKNQISDLLSIAWWDWDEVRLKNNISLFYDIEKFIEKNKSSSNIDKSINKI